MSRGYPEYVRQAAREYLRGTGYSEPWQYVQAGCTRAERDARLRKWCDTLASHRPSLTPPVIQGVDFSRVPHKSGEKLLTAIVTALAQGPTTKRGILERLNGYAPASVTCGIAELKRGGVITFTGGEFDPVNPPVYHLAPAREEAA